MKFSDLFKPKWQHSDSKIRKEALGKLTDENLLANIAITDTNWEIVNLAVQKISNQELLVQVANKLKDTDIPVNLIERLKDQELLGYIAKYNSCLWTRKNALTNLTDQSILEDVAKNDSSWRVGTKAYEKLCIINPLAIEKDRFFWDRRLNEFTEQEIKERVERDERDNDLRDAYERMSNTDPHESPFGFPR